MKLDDYIAKRYSDLEILMVKIKTDFKSRKSPELITDLWLEMRKRSMFVATEDDYWFFSVKYIKQRLTWKEDLNVEIKKDGKIKYDTYCRRKKTEQLGDYEINWNDVYISDRLDDSQLEKIAKIQKIYDEILDFYERQLYEWYFIDKLSIDKMTEKYNFRGAPISRSSVYNLVKTMIQKIKDNL
jgi:DNA-directed RNA polymerase specialized sigma subunit